MNRGVAEVFLGRGLHLLMALIINRASVAMMPGRYCAQISVSNGELNIEIVIAAQCLNLHPVAHCERLSIANLCMGRHAWMKVTFTWLAATASSQNHHAPPA